MTFIGFLVSWFFSSHLVDLDFNNSNFFEIFFWKKVRWSGRVMVDDADSADDCFWEYRIDFSPVGDFFFSSSHSLVLPETKHLYRALTIVNAERCNCWWAYLFYSFLPNPHQQFTSYNMFHTLLCEFLRKVQPGRKRTKTFWANNDFITGSKRIPIINTIELYDIIWFPTDVCFTFLTCFLISSVFQFVFIHLYSPFLDFERIPSTKR